MANDTRPVSIALARRLTDCVLLALREATKRGPSERLANSSQCACQGTRERVGGGEMAARRDSLPYGRAAVDQGVNELIKPLVLNLAANFTEVEHA